MKLPTKVMKRVIPCQCCNNTHILQQSSCCYDSIGILFSQSCGLFFLILWPLRGNEAVKKLLLHERSDRGLNDTFFSWAVACSPRHYTEIKSTKHLSWDAWHFFSKLQGSLFIYLGFFFFPWKERQPQQQKTEATVLYICVILPYLWILMEQMCRFFLIKMNFVYCCYSEKGKKKLSIFSLSGQSILRIIRISFNSLASEEQLMP